MSDAIERPSEQDLARNLVDDLKTCNRATPGPWRNTIRRESAKEIAKSITLNGGSGISQCSEAVEIGQHHETANVICWMGPAAGGFTGPCVGGTDDIVDARMIASARDGWPAAIRRARFAEAEAARLRAALQEAVKWCRCLGYGDEPLFSVEPGTGLLKLAGSEPCKRCEVVQKVLNESLLRCHVCGATGETHAGYCSFTGQPGGRVETGDKP